MSRADHLARRLAAVEQKRDARRLMHTYRLTDGRTARLSLLDAAALVGNAYALDTTAPPPKPPAVARALAQQDPADDPSPWGALGRAAAAEWCAAFDEGRPPRVADALEAAAADAPAVDDEGAPRG